MGKSLRRLLPNLEPNFRLPALQNGERLLLQQMATLQRPQRESRKLFFANALSMTRLIQIKIHNLNKMHTKSAVAKLHKRIAAPMPNPNIHLTPTRSPPQRRMMLQLQSSSQEGKRTVSNLRLVK